MLATKPNPFSVDALGKVPDGFWGVDCIIILSPLVSPTSSRFGTIKPTPGITRINQ